MIGFEKGMRIGGIGGPTSWIITLTAIIFLAMRGHGTEAHWILTAYLGIVLGIVTAAALILRSQVLRLETQLEAHHDFIRQADDREEEEDSLCDLHFQSAAVEPGVVCSVRVDEFENANSPPAGSLVRPIYLMLDPVTVENFVVREISCGSSVILKGRFAATMFEATRRLLPVLKPATGESNSIVIVVENISKESHVFIGMIEAEVVERAQASA